MRTIINTCGIATVLGMILLVGYVNADAADETVAEQDKRIEENRIEWNKFLSANCSDNDTEQTIRKLMDGKYREIGLFRANNETHGLLFLIDDFHEVHFGFSDKDSRLLFTPRVVPKGQWIRMPKGYVKSIRTPAETRLQTKLAEAAIEYVMKHTNRTRDSLSVSCQRSAESQTWDVVVALKSYELGKPGYLLEMTNDGVVVRGPFKNDGVNEKAK